MLAIRGALLSVAEATGLPHPGPKVAARMAESRMRRRRIKAVSWDGASPATFIRCLLEWRAARAKKIVKQQVERAGLCWRSTGHALILPPFAPAGERRNQVSRFQLN
jgi:hypothetical protein